MKVVYAAAAVDEVADILLALASDSSKAADRLQARLWEAERQIAAHPFSGRPAAARGVSLRSIVLQPYPYVLFYRTDGEEVLIVGIRHGAREPSTMPGGTRADLP